MSDHRPIGIVGSDGMAQRAAERIAATGQRVLLYVTGADHRRKLPKNIEISPTPTDIGYDCNVVLCFVDDSTAFRDLLIGTPDRTGLGAEMNSGAVIVDFGARPPRETQALLGLTGTRGIAIVDAALIGTSDDLEPATTTILVGGYSDAVDTAEPAIAMLGKLDRTGPLGSAHTAAALMGYMEAMHRIAHDEALAVGRALGLSGDTLARVLDGDHRRRDVSNMQSLTRQTGLAIKLAADRGVTANVLDFAGAQLARAQK